MVRLRHKIAHDFLKTVIKSKSKIFDLSVLWDSLDEKKFPTVGIPLLRKVAKARGLVIIADEKPFEYRLKAIKLTAGR